MSLSTNTIPPSETLLTMGVTRNLEHRTTFEHALKCGDLSQRVIAARALGWLRDAQCAPALLLSLNDPEPDVRRWVTASLSLSWVAYGDFDLIERFAMESEGEVRAAILRTLGWHRSKTAAHLCLFALSNDIDPEVRGEAAKALGRIDAQTYVSSLLDATKDDSASVRRHAIRSLMYLVDQSSKTSPHPPPIRPILQVLLECAYNDEDAEARSVALRILTHDPAPKAYGCLANALSDHNPCVRVNAVVALGQRGDLNALPLLKKHLSDPHLEVRARAREAIKNLET